MAKKRKSPYKTLKRKALTAVAGHMARKAGSGSGASKKIAKS